ncbi:MAG: hypothetical protein QOJ82_3992 [Solirubrobacteraceae bacterium]|jgi:hypothetical protein|nr:hypothetical protein [Solirubrobacteraceae bacterium]
MRYRDDYAGRLRACLDGASDWYDVERRFNADVTDDELDDARPVVYAFGYMLVAPESDSQRANYGVFAPRLSWGEGGHVPEPLGDLADEYLPIWNDYALATGDDPVAASRLRDLLWVRRHGERPVDHARAAARAYLALADRWESMALVGSLTRALELAVEINDEAILADAVTASLAAIEAEINEPDEWRPGIPLRLVALLVALRPNHRPPGLLALLDALGTRYGADPFIAQDVVDLRGTLLSADESRAEQEEQVARWRAEAAQATGVTRYTHLQHALEIARTHGLAELADDVLVELQAITPDELDLKAVEAGLTMPAAEVDAYVDGFAVGIDSLGEALARFGVEGPPSGKVEDNEELVRELAQRHPLTTLIPTQVLGAYGSLIFDARSEDDHHRLELAKHEALRIHLWAPIAARVLDALLERLGPPDHEWLGDFFTTDAIDREVGSRLADGLRRYAGGDLEGAAHTLVPQVETAIRALAARAGVRVIRNPRGQPGGVQPLGAILAGLGGRLDESWRRYLANLLTDSLGVNLRNSISHGLHGPVTRGEVALLVHAACRLAMLKVDRPDSGADADDGASTEP